MKNRISVWLLISILIASFDLDSQTQSHPATRVAVTIPGTHIDSIYSNIVGQMYRLHLNFPRGYNDTTKSFPALFLLDAQWDFPLAVALYGQQYYDGFVPAYVTVGISWGGQNANADSLRAKDFTPTREQRIPHSGQASNFLSFIRNELIPYVEKTYRITPGDRALMGSSFGGLFTLYAMFSDPSLFQRYALTSPALQWDDRFLLKMEKEFSSKRKDLPVRLFIGQGELEGGTTLFKEFVKTLESRSYDRFHFQSRIIEGAGHSGGKAEGFTRGIQWIHAWPDVNLPSDKIEEYTGTYESEAGMRVSLRREGNELVGQAPGGPPIVLRPREADTFYVKGFYFVVRFTRDGAGKVVSVEAEEYNRTSRAKRVQ